MLQPGVYTAYPTKSGDAYALAARPELHRQPARRAALEGRPAVLMIVGLPLRRHSG
jgi:hypothetical protein